MMLDVTPAVADTASARPGATEPPAAHPPIDTIATFVVPALLLLALQARHFGGYLAAQDDAQLIVYPELMAHGWVPWRDFETVYGVLHLWVLRGAYAVGGFDVETLRLMGVLFALVPVAGVVALGRRIGGGSAGLAAGILAAIVFSIRPAVPAAWVLGIGFALLAVASHSRLASGVLTGMAIACRPDLALIALVTVRRDVRWLTGVALGTSPLLVYAVMVGPWSVVDSTLVNGLRSGPYRRVGMDMDAGLLALTLASILVLAVVTRVRDVRFIGLVAVIGLYGFQRVDTAHLMRSGALLAGLAAAALIGAGLRPQRVMAGAIAAVLLVSSVQDGMWRIIQAPSTVETQVGERRWPDEPGAAEVAEAALAASEPGDRLFVGPSLLSESDYNDTFLYHLMPELEPSGPWLEFNPRNANLPGSGLADQVRSADVVILTTRYEDWAGPESHGPAEPDRVLRERFRMVERFGPWELWLPK